MDMKVGKLTAIVGPMFSRKTTELLRLIERESIAKRDFMVFNSPLDNRYGSDCIANHNGFKIKAYQSTDDGRAMQKLYNKENKQIHAVFIDETQFFQSNVLDFITYANLRGSNVYAAALDLTSEGNPFPFKGGGKDLGDMLVVADDIIRLTAVCEYCGNDATRTLCLQEKKGDVLVGNDVYKPACKDCWYEKTLIIDKVVE
jgi:thymidine kinase